MLINVKDNKNLLVLIGSLNFSDWEACALWLGSGWRGWNKECAKDAEK